MSYTDDPYAAANTPQVSPDDLRRAWRLPAVALGFAPAGAAAMVAPAYTDEQGQSHVTYPFMGLVNDLYARFGRAIPAATSFLLNNARDPDVPMPDIGPSNVVNLPPIPGTEAAEKNVKDAERWTIGNIPHPTIETPQEAKWAAGGMSLGEMLSPVIPAKVMQATGAAGQALRWFIPATHDVPMVAGVGTGLIGAGNALADAQEAQAQAAQPQWTIGGDTTTTAPVTPASTSGWTIGADTALAPPPPALPPPSQVGVEQGGMTAGQAAALTAALGVAAWVGVKTLPRGISALSDIVQGISRDPEVAARALDRTIAGGIDPSIAGGTIKPYPLPGNASDLSVRMANAVQNENAILDQIARGIGASKQDTEELIAKIHSINSTGTMNTKMEQQFRSGVSPSGRVGPSMMDQKIMIDQMPPKIQELANAYAWAKGEWPNRIDPARGGTLAGGGDPLTFRNVDDNTLRSIIQQGDNDPLVRAWYNQWQATHQFVLEDAYRSQLITKSQYDMANKLYANGWMPSVAEDGQIIASWNPRQAGAFAGWEQPPINAWDAQQAYYDKIYRTMQQNSLTREIVTRLENYGQNVDPRYRNLVREVAAPTADSIEVATANGLKHYEVANPYLRDALRRNPTQIANVLSWQRMGTQLAQSAAVGTIALMGGKFFAPTHMIRYMLGSAANLPREMYSGYLDKMLRQTIGMGIPGRFDPTAIPGILGTAGQNIGTAFTKNLHDVLSSSDHPATQMLSAMIGQPGVDAWRQWLNNRYLRSNVAEQASGGVRGGGGYAERDVRPRQLGTNPAYSRDLMPSVAPTVSSPSLLANPKAVIKRGAVSTYINLQSLIHDIHSAIIDSPNSFFYKLNKDNPYYQMPSRSGGPVTDKTRLGYAAQSLIGDPSTRGASRFAQSNAARLMFYNIAMQAGTSTLRSFRDHPLTWAAGMLSPLFMGSLGESISAILSGPEAVNHLEQHTSAQQKEANFYIYHGDQNDPTRHTEISIPQAARFLAPVVKELTHSFVGTWHALSDKSTYDKIVGAVGEMFGHHVQSDLGGQMLAGGIDAGGFPMQVSPGTQAAITAMGGKSSNIPQTVLENVNQNRPTLGGLIAPGDQARIPGQEGAPNELAKSSSDALRGVAHAFFGVASDALINAAHNAGIRWNATHDPMWVLQGVLSDYSQNAADQNRWGNIIWNKQLPVTTHGPVDERVDRAIANMKPMENFASDMQLQGFTRRGGVQIPIVHGSPIPPETQPEMRQIYITMGQTYQTLARTTLPQISDIYKQLEVLKDTPMMADEKRRIADVLTYRLSSLKQQVWSRLELTNDELSRIAGGRHVDVSKPIDMSKGVEQFHE